MNRSCINCPVRKNYTLAIDKQSGIIPLLLINKVANEEPYIYISETICSMCDLLRRTMERIVHVHNDLHLQTEQKAGRLIPDLLTGGCDETESFVVFKEMPRMFGSGGPKGLDL